MLKVENDNNLIRDPTNKAIINTNNDELIFYKQKRERDKKLSMIEIEHRNIKYELQEIKELIHALMERNK